MTFKEALKILNIEDYGERIFNSHSSGELGHLYDYIAFARALQKHTCQDSFREWFVAVVKLAEEHWSRPASIYQHMPEQWNAFVERKLKSANQ